MNQQENALVIFAEELGELAAEMLDVQKNVMKALRFGIDEQRDLPTSNRERIESEWQDLLGSIKNLEKHGIALRPDMAAIDAKLGKIERYNDYSESLGTVSPAVSKNGSQGAKQMLKRRDSTAMTKAVQSLQNYWNTYTRQTAYEGFSVETLLDDALYGVGVAIDKAQFELADGYELFKEVLRQHLDKPATSMATFEFEICFNDDEKRSVQAPTFSAAITVAAYKRYMNEGCVRHIELTANEKLCQQNAPNAVSVTEIP